MQPIPLSRSSPRIWGAIALAATLLPRSAWAADPAGLSPGLSWAIPFAGMLLSIALFPMLAPHFWHRRMGVVAAFWTLALLVPQSLLQGLGAASGAAWHAVLLEYLPFVTLLLALFTAGGGILLEGGPWGTPAGNTLLLAIGTILAGVMGTTGVSMVLIHPLLRANAHRRRRVHIVVFFLLLCANAGGATSPLGDPPLYLGFLHGVPFFWPTTHLTAPLLVLAVPLLAVFWLIDRHMASREPAHPPRRPAIRLRGLPNVALIAVIVAVVLGQGVWHPGATIVFGQSVEIQRLVGMAVFLAVTAISVAVTPNAVRAGNLFNWEPMLEVGILFAAIFITIGPVLAMLAAGSDGALSPFLALIADPSGRPIPLAYFWLCGLFSGFLDNAPTYLVFFQLAGNDPVRLTGELHTTLLAISAGSVFFGGLTYIGNAPNMMVRTIAAHRGIRMPGFFAYMAWSCALLGPTLVLLSLLFFR
jgi:Na+/H+ antiporter NhaD/arsenite permease-like protein